MEKYIEYENMMLANLTNFFSNNALIKLSEYQILTLKDLFEKFEDDDFSKSFEQTSIKLKNEILGTVKLLRCKYFGENPQIDYDNFPSSFGFSSRIVQAFSLYSNVGISPEILLEMARNDDFSQLIRRRNIGVSAVQEIRNKVMIIYNYYIEKKKEKGIVSLLGELQHLLIELNENIKEEQYNLIVDNILTSVDISSDNVIEAIMKTNQKIIETKKAQ